MPRNRLQPFLICYDIADPRRLGRVHRYLAKEAVPVQYSVFTATLSRFGLKKLIEGLVEIIHSGEDDVRIYPLPEKLRILSIGQGFFPEGVTLVERGRELLQSDTAA